MALDDHVDPRDLRTPEQVLADAEAYGVDVSLIRSNLRRTVEDRLLALDADMSFLREAHHALARQRGVEPTW